MGIYFGACQTQAGGETTPRGKHSLARA